LQTIPQYIDVILPLALANTYTYRISGEMAMLARVGMRIIVPFGKKKFYTGLVYELHNREPEHVEVKEVISLLDKEPVVRKNQLKFWLWIADYYQCTLGEVFKAALPSGLKLESETIISIVADYIADSPLKPKEQQFLDLLSSSGQMKINELSKEMSVKNILPLVKKLMDAGAVEIREEIKERYKPKTETYVKLTDTYSQSGKLEELFESLSRTKKQLDLLMFYLSYSNFFQEKERKEVTKKELLEKSGISLSVLNVLQEKGIMEAYRKEKGRLDLSDLSGLQSGHSLSDEQQKAYSEILALYREKQTVLLHGVTSSGKTEVYIHLIEEVLKQGKQVLFLLPEIALTTQITSRLKKVFGNKLGIYHSRFPDAERVEIWNNLLFNKGYQIILGVRSSVFLPFRELGLVIVDEEHENTYKQFDPAPRYHARNASIILASMHGAKVLLGSATPSVESYYNAHTGKYGLVRLLNRYEGIQLPEIMVADIKEARRKKQMKQDFSPLLYKEMKEALERKEQIILFQNRRGFAPYVECCSCSAVPRCKNCDVSLTYHKRNNELVCHYCGYIIPLPEKCPACGNPALESRGFGTEKIEEEIAQVFPEATVGRLDMDTARSRKNYEKIIFDFEKGKIDILIGTQMISKGLDFDRVRVVGVLNADSLLNYPDFRSFERAFQLMAQVAGRAGRRNNRGRVILQTSTPSHPVITQVVNNNYEEMYNVQLDERKLFKYPPFCRLIYIYVKGKDFYMTEKAADLLADNLKTVFGVRVYGPDKPVITRIQNLHIKKIMLKIEVEAPSDKAKKLLREIVNHTLAQGLFKSIFIQVDVDPV
jgi:primosomal protein N' (replication factor Y)